MLCKNQAIELFRGINELARDESKNSRNLKLIYIFRTRS